MSKTIAASMKQAILCRSFLIALLGMAAVILLSGVESLLAAFRSENLLSYGTHMELLLAALSSNGCMLALPVLCTLPYTTAYVDDSKSGYIKAYLPRSGLGQYIAGKTAACGFSGGLCVLLGAIIGYIVLTLLLLPKEAVGKPMEGIALRVAEKLMLIFTSGAFWSLVGFLLASITKSRYMAYAGPFVICYVLVILYERYFDKLYVLYPKEWLNPSPHWAFGAWGAVILLFMFAGIVCCIFALWVRRKLVEP
ncbi:hypothetical protein LJC42_06255 [Eubacteriales bacterium OttesenSCG-928-K08]|nr:hypothetical protein [Eubacteriales bacterium OttesenSCG-928-K08]